MPKLTSISIVIAGLHCLAVNAIAAEPTALIEEISGASSNLNAMDFVAPGETISLGENGRLVISYIESCTTETVTGGTVTVGSLSSKVEDGEVASAEASCQGSGIVLSADSHDATAGTVYRIKAFEGEDWEERTIKSTQPIFRWSAAEEGSASTVTVLDLDQDPPKELWQLETSENTVTYPTDAPTLEIGIPYQVRLKSGDLSLSATFSIDPELEGPDNAISRLVPLRPKISRAN